jgi:hypothetical protein
LTFSRWARACTSDDAVGDLCAEIRVDADAPSDDRALLAYLEARCAETDLDRAALIGKAWKLS